jgi:hypothetical protein
MSEALLQLSKSLSISQHLMQNASCATLVDSRAQGQRSLRSIYLLYFQDESATSIITSQKQTKNRFYRLNFQPSALSK